MTWQDVAGADTARWIAVLPLAAIEQHGPHLPLGVDSYIAEAYLARVRALNEIARSRGQSLAQMAIAWALRDKRVTSALIGARNVEQLDNSLDALKNLGFTDAELAEIDRYAQDGSIDLWKDARQGAA